IIAVAVVLGCLVPTSRPLFVIAPVLLLVATGDYVVQTQLGSHYVSNIGWPAAFPDANTLTWMAVISLLAGAVVEVTRWRPWRLEPTADTERGAETLVQDPDGPTSPRSEGMVPTPVVAGNDAPAEEVTGPPEEASVTAQDHEQTTAASDPAPPSPGDGP
ncbi:MAG: hypothetical protein ACRDVW_02765, partial [Acidimicrobiales bacterium]